KKKDHGPQVRLGPRISLSLGLGAGHGAGLSCLIVMSSQPDQTERCSIVSCSLWMVST
ncbi:hypothetical protein LDENG_00157010, partial [Lucifuga dentata]